MNNKTVLFVLVTMLAKVSIGQLMGANSDPVKILPLPPVNADSVLLPEMKEKPHVCFVNDNKALNTNVFREAVASVALAMSINLVATDDTSFGKYDFFKKQNHGERFGKNARILVFVVNKPDFVSYISVPGQWAMVNLNGLDRDRPDAERYRRRIRQMMLKGLAFACGVGGNPDSRCVMYSESFSLEGIDKTSLSYSPFADITIRTTLKALVGDAVNNP